MNWPMQAIASRSMSNASSRGGVSRTGMAAPRIGSHYSRDGAGASDLRCGRRGGMQPPLGLTRATRASGRKPQQLVELDRAS
jgi:hypothetical protein